MRDIIDLARQLMATERAITSDVVDDDSARAMRWWMNDPPTMAEQTEMARWLLRKHGFTQSLEASVDSWEAECIKLRSERDRYAAVFEAAKAWRGIARMDVSNVDLMRAIDSALAVEDGRKG